MPEKNKKTLQKKRAFPGVSASTKYDSRKTFAYPLARNSLKDIVLLSSVFVTGLTVLVIEIVATRILSPYYGNTIYTTSSVIGTILAALSLGYYVGGKLADNHPDHRWFYGIIFASGAAVIVMQILNTGFLPEFGFSLPITTGPLITSFLLFFIPTLLLGMLSPFAVALHKRESDAIGTRSGEVFFWSTMGSIVGSLLSGFLLIPHLGISTIVLVSGLLLSGWGLFGILVSWTLATKTAALIAIFVIEGIFVWGASPPNKSGVVYEKDGVYEKITIFDGTSEGHRTRFFVQDRSGSGAMYLDSDALAFDYTKYYSLYKLFKPQATTALVIGGGAYSIPKALLNDSPEMQVDVAEIEPKLFQLAKQYFRVPDTPRLVNHVEDGRQFLEKNPKLFDIIVSDVYYSLYSIPINFTSREFFNVAKSRLREDGVFIGNFIGDLSRRPPSLILSEIRTFRAVFPNSYFFAVNSPISLGSQNIIFVGVNGNATLDLRSSTITQSEDPVVRSLPEKLVDIDRFELSGYQELTDNFAPIEFLTGEMIDRNSKAPPRGIDGEEAMAIIAQQLRFGPRYATAPGHAKVQAFIVSELEALGVRATVQAFDYRDAAGQIYHLKNIIGSFYPDMPRRVILGTHYDSMRFSIHDREHFSTPPPGASNSASGVAALLEIGRYLKTRGYLPKVGVDLVFFDGEEGEEDWSKAQWHPIGSEYFARHIDEVYPKTKPEAGIILDVIGQKHLHAAVEDPRSGEAALLAADFTKTVSSQFPGLLAGRYPQPVSDDHDPLTAVGIPSILLIQFDYPYLDTPEDTLDKCSATSLAKISDAILYYIGALPSAETR